MSSRCIEVNGHPARNDIKQFLCLTVSDIAKLPKEGVYGTQENVPPEENEPCGVGSTAIFKTGEVYMLWPDNEWDLF